MTIILLDLSILQVHKKANKLDFKVGPFMEGSDIFYIN